jgi:Spy/CpxP family protein refolding chaperone
MKRSKWLVMTLATTLSAGGFGVFQARGQDSTAPAAPTAPDASQAVPAPPAHPVFRARMLARVQRRLGLTDDQVAQIKAQFKSEQDNLHSLRTRMQAARAGLRTAMQDANPSEVSVRAAAAQVAVVQSDFAVERLKLRGKIAPILTDEQRQKLGRIMATMNRVAQRDRQRVQERLSE